MHEASWKMTARTIVIAVLIGGAAGVLTASLTSSYLSEYAIRLGQLTEPLRLGEVRPRSVPQSYEEAIEAVAEKAVPSLAQVFDPGSNAPAFGVRPYDDEQAIMHGVVLTSDGWILTRLAPGIITTPVRLAQYEVVVGRDVYAVEQVIPHPDGSTFFFKVDGRNMPVIAFGSGWELGAGDVLFGMPARDGIVSTDVMQVDFDGGRVHADTVMPRTLRLSSDDLLAGSPIVNAAGELVAIASGAQAAEPIDEFLPLFSGLLRQRALSIPRLGVQTLDLTHSVGVPESLSRGHLSGALIVEGGIAAGSGAAQAGLRVGDIVLSVDGEIVNGHRTLEEYVIARAPGESMTLSLDREGERVTVEVTLGAAQ